MGECFDKGTRLNGRRQSQPLKTARVRTTVRPRPCGTHFPKYRGRRREAGATSPSANVVPRRGTEVFRFLIFTVPERGHVKLDPCLADAPCRLPGPATSKCDRAMRPPLFDLRRPV